MPLAQPLAELRQLLEAQIRENQLPEALNALFELLPDGSETHRIVSALITRLNAANKERYRNTISAEEYQRRVDQVSADFFDLLAGLTEENFEDKPASAKATSGKQGNVLYRVPQIMHIQKPVRCTIRVAVDEDAILENIVLDEDVHVKPSVEISDVMRAELVDAEGGVFKITALNAPNQLVRDTGYTEWNFSVTPLKEGVHQLLVKVSIMEIVPGYTEPILRDVSVMETVTIVTEGSPADLSAVAPAKAEDAEEALPKPGSASSEARPSEFKPSGQIFSFQSTATAQGDFEINYSKGIDPPADAPQARSSRRGLRTLAIFLAIIVLAPAATWALTPALDRELFFATLQTNLSGDIAPLDGFIQEHQQDPAARPYLDKAYFRIADETDSLRDLRVYQREFGTDGKYRLAVLQKIETHEIKAVQKIWDQPNAVNIRQFVAKFPESERLLEVKQAVEARAENRAELMAEVENAYVTSVQVQPTETKVAAYLRDFPNQERLNEVAEAVATRPEVMAKARPALEDAITRKMEVAATADQVREVLPALESAASSDAVSKVEKIVGRKSDKVKKQVQQQLRQSGERVRRREKIGDESLKERKLPETSELSGSSKPEENRNRRSGIYDMVRVVGDTYTMGSPKSETDRGNDECQHRVTVKTFSIGKYEVTQADWFEIMGTKPSHFKNCDECPVEQVSWDDIQDFLKALNKKDPAKNYRLPSEAEWEYAARGGSKSQDYKYAGSNDLGKVAWYNGNSDLKAHRVGELIANELGIFDMSGNVYEWCQDYYRAYPNCKASGSENVAIVVRSGNWSLSPGFCRLAFRGSRTSGDRLPHIGFRLIHE